jgi:hypothetical protein
MPALCGLFIAWYFAIKLGLARFPTGNTEDESVAQV